MISLLMAVMVAQSPLTEAAWLRPVWDDAGGRLEVAARAYEPAAGGPRVWLVGVIHVGEPGYYEAVEEVLALSEVVVFESVLPTGGTPPGGEDDSTRVEQTTATAELLARALAGTTASDWNGSMRWLTKQEPRMVGIVRTLPRDGWGRPWIITPPTDGAVGRIVSRGADGTLGGDDIVVDIPAEQSETSERGLQRTMAESLDLVFQLDRLPYGTPSWTPGDLSIDEIGAAFAARGERIEDLTDLLEEKGLLGGLARGIFGMIPTLDAFFGGRVVDTMHVMLIEMLGNESTIDLALSMQGPAFKEVLLDLRNERAMEVTDARMARSPGMNSIAVLYGAGHLSGLVELLSQRGDYEQVDERWLPAITLEVANSPLSRAEIDMLRGWVRGFAAWGTAVDRIPSTSDF
jgi:hypothetical protein